MNLNTFFKRLIDLAFYLMVPIVVFFPGTILYVLMFPEQTIINVNIPYVENGFSGKALLFSMGFFALFLLFFAGLYQMRKFAGLLLKNKLFSQEVVKRTHKTGTFFTACALGSLIFIGINSLFSYEGKISVTFGSSNFNLLLFLLIVGVLFLLLSDAFKKALAIKEENDLTV
ncbi:DUF2975 domain-containing protein [Leeuwenhoekiella marinoflava]|uniref:DUF2975 family protein n=2 Tax=Leeuwenhoekiella marinoflava TaxID=988 RepID=A0A4Q0PRI1_9FLAO|nr:DUF2975 domain-containing protein [Leeuwenhoekiella marinoflava]RXG33187.1 hypothetical protein DSL99_283 [Leeuwenhoekiella marinoflava]SHE41770.1 Protein of unknown function [Leeuwenhoekiella marinoflava DSM 3653]